MKTAERFFENNKGIIQKLAWKWARKTGKEFEEFYQVGCEALVTCIKEFNPKAGSFSTFCWHCCNNAMTGYWKKQCQKFPSTYYWETFKSVTPISEKLMELTPQSREIVSSVIQHPEPLLRARKQSKIAEKSFRQIMMKRGFSWQAAESSYKEINTWLKERLS